MSLLFIPKKCKPVQAVCPQKKSDCTIRKPTFSYLVKNQRTETILQNFKNTQNSTFLLHLLCILLVFVMFK